VRIREYRLVDGESEELRGSEIAASDIMYVGLDREVHVLLPDREAMTFSALEIPLGEAVVLAKDLLRASIAMMANHGMHAAMAVSAKLLRELEREILAPVDVGNGRSMIMGFAAVVEMLDGGRARVSFPDHGHSVEADTAAEAIARAAEYAAGIASASFDAEAVIRDGGGFES